MFKMYQNYRNAHISDDLQIGRWHIAHLSLSILCEPPVLDVLVRHQIECPLHSHPAQYSNLTLRVVVVCRKHLSSWTYSLPIHVICGTVISCLLSYALLLFLLLRFFQCCLLIPCFSSFFFQSLSN